MGLGRSRLSRIDGLDELLEGVKGRNTFAAPVNSKYNLAALLHCYCYNDVTEVQKDLVDHLVVSTGCFYLWNLLPLELRAPFVALPVDISYITK